MTANYLRVVSNLDSLDALLARKQQEHQQRHFDRTELARRLQERIRGQDAAMVALAEATACGFARQVRRGPVATFLFVGPPGVGKTETAKVLSEILFGNEKDLLHISCQDYPDAHTGKIKLLGLAKSFQNAEPGLLTSQIDAKGMRVVLFDEIEKMDRTLSSNIFLNLLNDGWVQDAYTDVRVDFTKTVIIITSNLAHKRCANIAQTVEDPDARTKAFRDIFVQNGFREEMLNRIPAIIYFAELPPRQQAEIGAMRITQIAQDYGLEVTDIAVEVLAELVGAVMTNAGGARQIQQLLEKALRRDLADLSGARCRGGPAMIRVVLQDGLIRAVADAAPRRTAPGSSNTP